MPTGPKGEERSADVNALDARYPLREHCRNSRGVDR
jgi:hypothetical protein